MRAAARVATTSSTLLRSEMPTRSPFLTPAATSPAAAAFARRASSPKLTCVPPCTRTVRAARSGRFRSSRSKTVAGVAGVAGGMRERPRLRGEIDEEQLRQDADRAVGVALRGPVVRLALED